MISDMHRRITYMYINFQQNWVSRSVTNRAHKHICKKLQIAQNCNLQLEFQKSRLFNMHYHITDILANFEINQPIRYQVSEKRNY